MKHNNFFWLHIKKSAGITTRSLLQPYYKEVDRIKQPKSFIQSSFEEYNDTLNNYRITLGEYQFKRCLFAKEYLYKEEWENMFSFAFSREPVDRCLSMFYYLFWQRPSLVEKTRYFLKGSLSSKRLTCCTSYAFDVFLDYVQKARISDSIYTPFGQEFTTHTAPMWDDITDLDGNILLKKTFRLENLVDGINYAFEACGIEKRLEQSEIRLNKNKRKALYEPSKRQLDRIEKIYFKDFEIYEKANL